MVRLFGRSKHQPVPSLTRALRYSELNCRYFDADSPAVRNYLTFVNNVLAQSHDSVVIVGLGVAGTVMAMLLARRGFRVTIYERFPEAVVSEGVGYEERTRTMALPSDYPLTLSPRGLYTLSMIGLRLDPNTCVPVTHQVAKSRYSEASVNLSGEHLVNTSKRALIRSLVALLRSEYADSVKVVFNCKFLSLVPSPPSQQPSAALFSTETSGRDGAPPVTSRFTVPFALLVGADGIFSSVRDEMFRTSSCSHVPSTHPLALECYVFELPIAEANGLSGTNNTHYLSRGCQIKVCPISAVSFLVTVFLDETCSALSAGSSATERVSASLALAAPSLLTHINFFDSHAVWEVPEMCTALADPIGTGSIALIGDAGRSIHPCIPHGANIALEDCILLDQALQHSPSIPDAVLLFNHNRCRDNIAVAKLADLIMKESPWTRRRLWITRSLCPCMFPLTATKLLSGTHAQFEIVLLRWHTERRLSTLFAVFVILSIVITIILLCFVLYKER